MNRSPRPTRRTMLTVLAATAAVTVVPALAACGSDDASAGGSTATTDGPRVVASTGWVAAIARLAGAENVTIIAPSTVQHPPDYEPKPSDLAAVAGADYVFLAGFEGFADRLKAAAGGDAKVETVATTYDPAKLEKEVTRLGGVLGTGSTAAANAATVRADLEGVCTDLRARLGDAKPVVVSHLFVTEWAACAGLTPKGTFGPAPITPGEVKKLSALSPTLVLENRHMAGSAEAVAASSGAKVAELVNFPDDGDLDLIKVANEDAGLIAGALGK